jgi:hypothetical protein
MGRDDDKHNRISLVFIDALCRLPYKHTHSLIGGGKPEQKKMTWSPGQHRKI